METSIKRLGNSKGIILPSHILKVFGLKVADRLTILVENQTIILKPIKPVTYDSMKSLFKGYQGTYRPQVQVDDNQGKEVW
ncbi:MAG: Antidote-toxin recognition MazE, bacterial antitoxin [Bacillota bacterium]|jgi:antitoxin component of MazEF toxin-antitoxin module